ncbi:hypothetical protein MPH_14160, partial [Macrophomina phaseolina MS6]
LGLFLLMNKTVHLVVSYIIHTTYVLTDAWHV